MRSKGTEPKEVRSANRVVTTNRRANYDYFIDETLEAGLVLQGTEIKAIREGKISISEAYARIQGDELLLIGATISPYSHGSYTNHEPDRPRKLLAHKKQIRELREQVEQKGRTLIPLRVRLKDGRAKIDIGLARGKRSYDKRQTESERDAKREIQRAMRDR